MPTRVAAAGRPRIVSISLHIGIGVTTSCLSLTVIVSTHVVFPNFRGPTEILTPSPVYSIYQIRQHPIPPYTRLVLVGADPRMAEENNTQERNYSTRHTNSSDTVLSSYVGHRRYPNSVDCVNTLLSPSAAFRLPQSSHTNAHKRANTR